MILVCGEALVDLFVSPASTRDSPASTRDVATEAVLGGSPFNVAVGLSRLGVKAAFFGGISNDVFGQALFAKLAREGVDLSSVKRSDLATTISVVATDAEGRPSYAFYGENNADRDVTPADLPAPGESIEAICVGSYTIAVPPIAEALLALAGREAGRTTISLDLNIRPTVMPDMEGWRTSFEALLPYVDIIKASDDDLRAGYGDQVRIEDLAAAWHAAGASLVVLTRGERGASAYLRGHREISVPGRAVAVVDTVGAGDTFHAAMLAHLSAIDRLARPRLQHLGTDELGQAVRYAVAASSITCTRKGADLPTHDETRRAVEGRGPAGG